MACLEFSVEIAAPTDRVFVFFVPQRMVYWYGTEMQVDFELQGGAAEFAVGQKVRITGRMARREVSLTAVVTRYEWLRALEWRFHDAYGVKGMQSWELAPLSESATRIVMRDEYELPGRFGHLWDWLLMRHAVARRNRSSLAKLKSLSERT